jgi:PleD family two-component response regulator
MEVLEQAVAIAETILQAASEPVQATPSIGVTLARPGESVDGLIAWADQAMVQAKQGGRNLLICPELRFILAKIKTREDLTLCGCHFSG